MKLSTAFAIATIVSSTIQTVKSDASVPDCSCDRRDRLLMGFKPLELQEEPPTLKGSQKGAFGRGLVGPPEGLPDTAKAKAKGLFDKGEGDVIPPPFCDDNPHDCCQCEDDPFDGELVPEVICCNAGKGTGGEGNGADRNLMTSNKFYQTRPQGSPSYEDSELLDDTIGLWKLHNFLSEDEVEDLKGALEHSTDMYWDCKVDHCTARRGLAVCLEDANHPSRVQPDGKQCLMVTDRVKEASSAEDAENWDGLTRKYQSVWPEYPFTAPMFAQIQEGEVEAFKFHVDGESLYQDMGHLSPVTIIVYLTDGGSPTYFPKANDGEGVLVTPKAGMAITWYNIDDQDQPFKLALHGVLPGSPGDGKRITIQNKFTDAPVLHGSYW